MPLKRPFTKGISRGVVPRGGGGGVDYAGYTTALSPLVWLRLRETSGNPANSGSASLTITQTNCTQGQTGQLGENEAYSFNGTTSTITITQAAAINGIAELTALALLNPATAGEADSGQFFIKGGEWELRFATTAVFGSATYDAFVSSTTTGGLTLGSYNTVGLRLGSDKTVRIFINGVQAAYIGSPGVGTGNRASSVQNMIVGNNSAAGRTIEGLYDEMVLVNRALTDAEILQWHNLAMA